MKKRLPLLWAVMIWIFLVAGAGTKGLAAEWETFPETQSVSDGFTDREEAVAYLKAQLLARNPFITVTLRGDNAEMQNTQLLEMALQHTGQPKEGDYLKLNMRTCSYSITCGTDQNGPYTTFAYAIQWLADARQEAEVDAAVESLLETLDLWNAADYDKVKGVYDWITANIVYDYDWDDENTNDFHKHSAHAAIIDKKAVCQGIVLLCYRLCLELGVDCRCITGNAGQVELEAHGWNIVRLEDRYYHMDPTWDLGMTNVYRYFLVSGEDFPHHYRDSRYTTAEFKNQYPMAQTPYVQNIAASGMLTNGIRWVLDGNTGTLTVTGTGAIPSYRFADAPWKAYRDSVLSIVVGEGITEVGERAFYWCKNCTSVSLPNSLIAIREYGFNNLRSLQEITLPPNLRIIEFCGFSECVALRSITLPDSVTTVGTSAFSNCPALTTAKLSAGMTTVPDSIFFGDRNLQTVILPQGITTICDTAFMNCGFREFTIPASVKRIETGSFAGCTALKKFIVEAGNTAYKAVDGVLFSADGTHLICYPAYKTGSYVVPEGTQYIDYDAFRENSYLTGISFPSTLRKIDDYAFSWCSGLSSITFPENITFIGDSAFRSCTGLTSVTFRNETVTLEGYVFAGCYGLRKISLPEKLTSIPHGLLSDCIKLTQITIPATVTSIGSTAFYNCDSLTTVTIPGHVKSIGQQAFDYCGSLTTLVFEEGVRTLDWIAVRNAPYLTKVVIPASVTSIGKENFVNCPRLVLYVECGTRGHSYAVGNGYSYNATHSYSRVEVTEPTCTTYGYTSYFCACGGSYTDHYLEPFGHHYGDWYTVSEADCTTAGRQRRDCARCGQYETKTIAAKGHRYTATVTKPSCTSQGYTTHICACGDSYTDADTPALGHLWDSGEIILAPTEETEGQRRFACGRCGQTKTEWIPKLDHVHKYTAAVIKPTCTGQGYTAYTCSCGDGYQDTFVAALGHNMGAWRTVTEAACLRDGQQRRDCARCDFYETKIIAATGHSYRPVVTKPGCTAQGYTTHTCICGDTYNDTYVNALGHKDGNRDHVCDNGCGITQGTHADGSDADHKCDYGCGATLTSHRYTAVVTQPTCTENGYTTHTCACGDGYQDTYTNPRGHQWNGGNVTKQATCKEAGIRTYTCTVCGGTKTEPVAKLTTHTYNAGAITKQPTCKEAGVRTYTCTVCGGTKTEPVAKLTTHTYNAGAITKQPTCKEAGVKTYTCTVCGGTKTEPVAKLTTHTYNAGAITKQPTCKEAGVKTYTCTVCGGTKTEPVAKLTTHTYNAGAITKQPTCKEAGIRTYTCTVCGGTKTESVAKLTTHTYGSWIKVSDSAHKHSCAVCGKEETGSHSWNSGVVTKEPTKEAEGVKTYTCSVCKGTRTEVLPRIPTYAVVFLDWDGTVLSTKRYAIGEKVTAPAGPTRADDAQYTYTFRGWDKPVVDCNGAATYRAAYTAKSRVPITITSSTLVVSGATISKIGVGETVEKLLEKINEGSYVTVYSEGKEVPKDTLVGTGMEVKILDGNTVKASYTAVVTGDTNGDGRITITDMLAAKAHLLKKNALTGEAAQAADTSGDNAISITDFLQLKAHILGKSAVTPRSVAPVAAQSRDAAPKVPEQTAMEAAPGKIVLALPRKKTAVVL